MLELASQHGFRSAPVSPVGRAALASPFPEPNRSAVHWSPRESGVPKEAPARSGRITGISGDSCSAESLQLIDGKPFILNCIFGEAPSFLPGKPFGPNGFQPVPRRFIRFALLNLLRGSNSALQRGTVDGRMTAFFG
jgi:hypothetical protein